MLGSFRKFSGSIYAKILLGIIIIPFVFWGMGSSITGGSKNVVVVIDKEKYSTQEFIDFIRKFAPPDKEINDEQIEEFLSFFKEISPRFRIRLFFCSKCLPNFRLNNTGNSKTYNTLSQIHPWLPRAKPKTKKHSSKYKIVNSK